jgi:hypothetical protein
MSTQLIYGLAKAFCGLEPAQLNSLFDDLDRRYFRPFMRKAEAVVEYAASLPEIPGYEKLLREKCGYGPLGAKIFAMIVVGALPSIRTRNRTGLPSLPGPMTR